MLIKNKWLKSFFHAIVLFCLSVGWTNSSWATQDEIYIVKWSSWIKDVLFRKYPDPNQFLFVDVAHDKDTVSSNSGFGVDVITDRKKLAKFFQKIDHKNPTYRFLLCDIFLKGKTKHDSLLSSVMKNLKCVALATHFDENGSVEKINFNIPKGITSAEQDEHGFFKFKLFQDEKVVTLPVLMYEQISGHHITKSNLFFKDSSSFCFNTMIIDQSIRDYSVFHQNLYNVVRLSYLLSESDKDLNQAWLKNRIVIIGDFENDRHDTIFGKTAGAIIMLNAYLAMQKGLHTINWWWVCFMLISFTIIAKIVFYHRTTPRQKSFKWLGPLIKDTMLLSIFSVCSYLLFDRHVQVLFVLAYIYIVNFWLILRTKPFSWQHFKNTVIKIKRRVYSE